MVFSAKEASEIAPDLTAEISKQAKKRITALDLQDDITMQRKILKNKDISAGEGARLTKISLTVGVLDKRSYTEPWQWVTGPPNPFNWH